MTSQHDQQRKLQVREAADRLRQLARRTPQWEVRGHDVVDQYTEEVALRLDGPWAPDLVRLFSIVDQTFLLSVATLMEAAAGSITKPLDVAVTLTGMINQGKPATDT